MPPIIPQSLQPQQRGQIIKPPTVAEQRLIRQYGSVEAGRAIQAQQAAMAPVAQVIPQGAITKKEIETQITQTQTALNKLSADRAEEYRTLTTGGRSLGASQLESFNIKWNLMREQLRTKRKSLQEIKTAIGTGYVSQQAVTEYLAGRVSGVAQELESGRVLQAKQQELRAEQRAAQEVYEDVVTKFGTTLEPQEIVQLTPMQVKVLGVTGEDIVQAREYVSGETYTTTKVKVPSGWTTEEVLDVHKEFAKAHPEMTWEQIVSDPSYQKKVQEIASRPESRESMKAYAERRNLLGSGYGEDIVSVSTPESRALREQQSIQLAEMAEAARYRQTFLGQAFDVSERLGISPVVKKVTTPIGVGISAISTGLTAYAEAVPITKVGETINLPITRQGFDIVKATGDILLAYKYDKQSEITGKKSVEDKSRFLSREVDKLNFATTQEQVNKIISDIKNKGIKVEEITTETGELSYKFNIPIPKALQDKLDATTFASFFTSASGVAYGTTFAGLTLSPGGLESTAGRIGTVVGETTPYLAGAFGGLLIAEPFIEKGLYGEKGELREYTIEHPFESLLLGAVVAGGIYGAVQKVKVARRFKSFNQAKAELKRLQEYHKTIQPQPVGKGASYIEGYTGKLTKTQFKQFQKLNIEKRILDQALNVKFSAAYQEFSRTVPTMSKTTKGFYQVNEFGKTIKFFNNQFTITFISKEGKAITVTLAARSNRPLKTLDAFIKYGRDKRIITGFTAGDYTALSMGRYWGGEIRDARTFIAKETTEEGTKGLRRIEVRETFGAEKYTDDFAELFGISPKVGETKFEIVKGVKEPLAFGEISITGSKAELDLFMGIRQKGAGIQFTKGQTGIGDPLFTKLVKEQATLKARYIKPKVFDLKLVDDVVTKVKPKPRPDVLSYDIFGTGGRGLVQEQKIAKITKDVIATQEAATRSFGITDIKTRAPPSPKVPSRFGEIVFSDTKFGRLGALDSRFKISTEEIEQEKVSLISEARVRVKERQIEEEGFGSIAPISRVIIEPKVEEKLDIIPMQLTDLQSKQVQQLETATITDTGIPVTPAGGTFYFPGESPFKFISPMPLRKPKYQKGTRTGYHAFIKSKGKYRKVTDKPHTKSAAKDVGARYTDTLLSADFKISPIKQTKVIKGKKRAIIKRFQEDELRKGDNYFGRNVHKFRNFMIKRGQKVQMNNRWIEKKQHRADTKSEQQGLTLFQFKARETKRRAGLPTRRTKKKSTSRQRFRL